MGIKFGKIFCIFFIYNYYNLNNTFIFECILKCKFFLWSKLIFSIITPRFSDPSEIIQICWFDAQ